MDEDKAVGEGVGENEDMPPVRNHNCKLLVTVAYVHTLLWFTIVRIEA